ncbi:bb9db068-7794-4678-a884-f65b470c13c0 [Thermothielavioides terrestris]|uniref:Bb9db068-7794-4678-a884-f65b470c13c0 n=1 Tax=Thermothielavioides terrestris TaxID=2587410 RepID=A0A3S4AUT1_9PEZI|nr:bb9db068-7794-4678-a884-f65b470c13c0 [Thermothielavioides terrestris]
MVSDSGLFTPGFGAQHRPTLPLQSANPIRQRPLLNTLSMLLRILMFCDASQYRFWCESARLLPRSSLRLTETRDQFGLRWENESSSRKLGGTRVGTDRKWKIAK